MTGELSDDERTNVPTYAKRAKRSKRQSNRTNPYYKSRSRRQQYQAQAALVRDNYHVYHRANMRSHRMEHFASVSLHADAVVGQYVNADSHSASPAAVPASAAVAPVSPAAQSPAVRSWENVAPLAPPTPTPLFDVAMWPREVIRVTAYDNPLRIQFDYTHGFGRCECLGKCSVLSCQKARMNVVCTSRTCAWGDRTDSCCDRLQEYGDVQLVRFRLAGEFRFVATRRIDRGTILCAYFGTLSYESRHRAPNSGFRMAMKTPSRDGKRLEVDAAHVREMMGWANHSCSLCAIFFLVGSGRVSTVVAVMLQTVEADQEITVSHGKQL
ncbi:hypothetical protein BBJ28_00022503 [Nothophytophthora sp. Chile5]|nr:hypothetical protein BBJ28_00022503 [Nothophytophthora sp. Chile5]